ncbi:hypothetical protein [Actinocrispum wychmicini]|uniref:ABC-2 family transporter n=1 Tax=Actinocrispum wychmicini TaxID=1213861 RepID=A0A4R2JX63_9PSEU|nr:hypothetical protein [Actinocrispum wychmicini]TCO58735.1 hypothetical protein EV192_105807 [Actinocrispum wychmicini]
MTALTRDRIDWGSWVWIAWRQHRTSILLATGVTVVVAYSVASRSFDFAVGIWPYAPTVLSTLTATFWAAPMVAREFEDRTNVFAWSQDATPQRWVVGRSLPLVVVAAALVAILNIALLRQIGTERFTSQLFEANPLVHTTYVVFGFALGLAFGTLLRQTPGAIAGTLTVFLGVRIFVALFLRMHLMPPERSATVYGPASSPEAPSGAYIVDSGYLDNHNGRAAAPFAQTEGCANTPNPDAQATCYREAGISAHFTDYQPRPRMPVLQLAEGMIYLALTALLLWFVTSRLRARRHI